jgi:membrane fusion protein (multidrug efflux system)
MKLKITLALTLLLLVIGGLAGPKAMQIGKLIAAGKAFSFPPTVVSSATVTSESWSNHLEAIGTITAVQGVTLTPEIPGVIRELLFESGSLVKAGDLLVRLDTSSEDAQLRAIEAQVELAQLSVNRQRNLRTNEAVSQAELDTAEATLKQTQANADNIRATIAKKHIRAPFAGQLGLRQVNLGQYLETGRPIVTLQSLATVYADFSLPQQALGQLRTGMTVRVTTDAYPDREFSGTLAVIAPELNESTRSLVLRANLANADFALRPGMFARMAVQLPERREALVIPGTCILSAPYGDSVFIIESSPRTNGPAGLTVRQQLVRLGPARGNFVVVEAGLKPGDKVVSSGLFKLQNGAAVLENNELSPKPEKSPQPADS